MLAEERFWSDAELISLLHISLHSSHLLLRVGLGLYQATLYRDLVSSKIVSRVFFAHFESMLAMSRSHTFGGRTILPELI